MVHCVVEFVVDELCIGNVKGQAWGVEEQEEEGSRLLLSLLNSGQSGPSVVNCM